ncbi:MAG TPA: hypothetical protein VH024_09920 [Candidatus Angelobacter sp.]|jgi:hypothetical protein|nr:hypothetical protein [Candidatus Angelobacter sp.]
MANRVIEIHDSELKSIAVSNGEIVLELSPAYIHQSEGRPGMDAGTGWLQDAVIRILGEEISGSFSELPCDLWDGQLKLPDESLDNTIPIPLSVEGHIELQLTSCSGESVQIRGDGITLQLRGEPRYLEKASADDV